MCYFKEPPNPSSEGIYNHPEAGWIYNTNSFEGQSNIEKIWLLSTDSEETKVNCVVDNSGKIAYWFGGNVVRPVVYLKPSIHITGGEGTEQNPYVLLNF